MVALAATMGWCGDDVRVLQRLSAEQKKVTAQGSSGVRLRLFQHLVEGMSGSSIVMAA